MKKTITSPFKTKDVQINLQKDFIVIKYGNGVVESFTFGNRTEKNKYKWDSSINPKCFVHKDDLQKEQQNGDTDNYSTDSRSNKSDMNEKEGPPEGLINREYIRYDYQHQLYYIDQDHVEDLVYRGDINPARLFRLKGLKKTENIVLGIFEDQERGIFEIDLTKPFSSIITPSKQDRSKIKCSYACISFSKSMEMTVFYSSDTQIEDLKDPRPTTLSESETRKQLLMLFKNMDKQRVSDFLKETYGYKLEDVNEYIPKLCDKLGTFKDEKEHKIFAKNSKKPKAKRAIRRVLIGGDNQHK